MCRGKSTKRSGDWSGRGQRHDKFRALKRHPDGVVQVQFKIVGPVGAWERDQRVFGSRTAHRVGSDLKIIPVLITWSDPPSLFVLIMAGAS